jgi:outer membrane receptor protein involved in Fe transport
MKLLRPVALTLVISSLLAIQDAAGQSPEKGDGRISGTIIDSSTNQPVEFATIALIDPATSKPVDGTVADEKGKFTITKIAEGNYKVTISFIGYETYSQDVAITGRKSSIDMGTLKLGAAITELDEVVVEGERSLVEEKVDRTIYNAENDATTRGGDAADVLRRVPMLTVDMDGNVSLRGNQNIRVLINNKPSTITASSVADALKQIPADQIKTVEVITSPSAKYDAEGSAGIINIITKKTTMQGFTLGFDTNVGLRGSHLGLNANLRTGKMGFSLGGFGRTNYNVTGNYLNQQSTEKSDGTISLNRQEASTRNQGIFGNYNFGWDYDINKKNSLVASVRFGTRNGRNFQDGMLTQSFNNSALVSSSLQNIDVKDLSGNVDGALTYTKTFDVTGREFSLMGSFSQNNRTNDFVNTFLNQADESVTGYKKNNNDSYNREVTFQADYQTPVFKNNIFEIGGKNIARLVNSKYQLYNAGADGEYIPNFDPRVSNSFDYRQNVTAGYLSYTAQLPKGYSLKAGGRYEYTIIDANFQDEQEVVIPAYGVLVPSVNLSRKLKNGTAKVAYNRRIQRPSLQYLNPNIQSQNILMPTVGNPLLSPEYTNNYEVSYSTFIKAASLNFSAFVRNTNDAIQSVRDTINVAGQQGVSTTYANIGREDAYGGSVFANITVSDKFTLNGGADVYYAVLNNNSPNPSYAASNRGWVASGRLFGNYSLTKMWALQFFSFYRGNQVQLQGSQSGFAMYSLSIKRDFANKRGSVGLGAENFFNFNGFTFRNESASPVLIQKSTNTINNMSFKVNFSYRFGKMSFDQRPSRRRSINNDDLKDGGDGNGNGGGMDGGGQQGGGGGNFGGAGGGNRGGVQRPAGAAAGAAVAVKVPASDPSAVVNAAGNWTYTVESPQGGNGTIVIKKEGEVYTGTMTNARFNRENQLKEITVKGNEISFGYDVNFNGNASTVTVKGTISGDTLTGVMNVGTFGSYPINAKKSN